MLFLVSTPRVVSLEVAAKILIGEDPVEDINKCKFKSEYYHRQLSFCFSACCYT